MNLGARAARAPGAMGACLMISAILLLLSGCAFRLAAPAQLDQAVRIQVVADQGRIPRAGVDLQAAVAEAVAYRTGWRVHPDGAARLDLSIDRDEFSAAGDNSRGIATRWRHHVLVTALLVTPQGTRTWSGSGTGYAGSRAEEISASKAAAADAADQLARWLATDSPVAPASAGTAGRLQPASGQ